MSPKQRTGVSFRKVQASTPQQNQLTSTAKFNEKISETKDHLSLRPGLNLSTSASTNLNIPINNQNKRMVNYSTNYIPGSFVPVNFQTASYHQSSNHNINSQMTVSNAGPARRIQYLEGKTQIPRMNLRENHTNINTYGVAKDLQVVNNLVKNIQNRVSYLPTRGTTISGQSIYLK